MPPELELAVSVAKATGRPLLLRGNPGSGKSSLAPYVAREEGWRYYEYVVTSQTRATDLLWKFDGVRRLADAQMARHEAQDGQRAVDEDAYTEPGPLWWAYSPKSADEVARKNHQARMERNLGPEEAVVGGTEEHDEWIERWNRNRKPHHAVVLIDEIDKADPDVPNGLLVPLASHDFTVTETGRRVVVEPADNEDDESDGPFRRHLVIITTNEERELPQAFLRRCVIASAPEPTTAAQLVEIAVKHLNARLAEQPSQADLDLAQALADELLVVRKSAAKDGIRPPSTAEYLDALWACRALKIKVNDGRWEKLKNLTLIKPQHMAEKT
ncbi:AAA family ATPase [Streptomyces tauricus]|uniref:AAA family ATPase n=1 Tax=Streptomyces tauricus TaxID=68274 RepID=UPI0033B028BC